MLRLILLSLALLPTLALAQLPSYTLVDLGPDDDPNGLGPRGADCLVTPAGTDNGNPLYQCRSWDLESVSTLDSISAWVGYEQLPAENQAPELYRRPVESFLSCCGIPPPNQGLNTLSMPAGESSYGAEATSLSEGAQYVVGHGTHLVPSSSGGSAELRQAIVWDNLTPYVLPALAGNETTFDSAAYAVSSSGEVVGESQMYLNVGGYALRATEWIDHSPHELQYMLSPAVNMVFTTARWIDCAGNIIVQGWPASYGSFQPGNTIYPHNYLLERNGASRNCQ